MEQIKFTKLSETAKMPVKAHKTDAGWDLFTDEDITLDYGETKAIATNIAIELPDGFVADIRPRSGLTLKTGIRVHYGTIDAGYRNGIGIIVENGNHTKFADYSNKLVKYFSDFDENNPVKEEFMIESFKLIEIRKEMVLKIPKGFKIAQMVVLKLPDVEFVEGTLNDSDRGQNGFGSTGTN